VWSTFVGAPLVAHGLAGAVAIVDPTAERVLMLSVGAELELAPTSFPIGRGFAASATTRDAERLLVLTRGQVPRVKEGDPPAALTVVGGTTSPSLLARYELADPRGAIAVDPEGRFAVLHAGVGDASFVENPNELVVVDLSRPPAADNPTPITLRSFGGTPERFTFTPSIAVPGGERRLLVVETDRDVALIDLDDLALPEVTVPLTSGAETVSPAGVALTEGDPERDDDARVAVRLEAQPNVILVDLLPLPEGESTPQGFRVVPNIVFAGGTPSDVVFLSTDGGLRLGALVPSREALVLIDPDTGLSTEVALGAPFESVSLVTNVVGPTDGGSDVALLWSRWRSTIAFVALGSTIGKPYKSVETLELPTSVAEVIDVPPPNQHLKLLAGPEGTPVVVLDLVTRTASPLVASGRGATLRAAADGERVWLVERDGDALAQVDLASLHPKNLVLERPIQDAFDVQRGDGGRALVALHPGGAGSITVLDAKHPSITGAREYAAVLLGELP
jgi:hypothetical protein